MSIPVPQSIPVPPNTVMAAAAALRMAADWRRRENPDDDEAWVWDEIAARLERHLRQCENQITANVQVGDPAVLHAPEPPELNPEIGQWCISCGQQWPCEISQRETVA